MLIRPKALSYIELEFSMNFSFHSLRVRYEPSEGSMLIDLAAIVSLELIQNLQNAKSKDCLFGLLNQTLTAMGSRLLRSNILQPSTEESKLSGRYDAIEELSTNEEMFFCVRQGSFRNIPCCSRLTHMLQLSNHLSTQIEFLRLSVTP